MPSRHLAGWRLKKVPMNAGLLGQKLTLMEELRAATHLIHTAIQSLPFFEALLACQLPLESYAGLLRALACIHRALETGIAAAAAPAVRQVWQDGMRKLPLLQRDLSFFEPRVLADIHGATTAAEAAARFISEEAAENPLALLGCLYVLEGSTMGAAVLHPRFARAFLLAGEDGLAYLRNYGAEAGARWAQFSGRMNGLCLSQAEREWIVRTAQQFFARLKALHEALFPFLEDSKVYLASTINAEAGRHPVPADPGELEASFRAAERCGQQFPYCGIRYGERGRRFARSDSAWLATLCQFAEAQVVEQVRWLSRVLATRGMPSLILQTHLAILREELARAHPEKAAVYQRLDAAAAALQTARRKHLADAAGASLAQAFEAAAGPGQDPLAKTAGALLVCAVADEREGSDGAIENLRAWMVDATRFPPAWIQAVEATLAQAHALADSQAC